MESKNTIHPVDQKLPAVQTVFIGLQHAIIAILSAIPVPLIIAANTGLPKSDITYFISTIILSTGIASILASIGFRKISPRAPLVMGAAFAVIPICIVTINGAPTTAEGFQLIAGGTIAAGLAIFLLAPLWSKLTKFFPPVVVATNTMVLGLVLISNAYSWILEGSSIPGQVDLSNLLLALFVFCLFILFSKILKGFLSNLNILFCLAIGTVAAAIFGMVDFFVVQEANVFEPIVPFVRYGLPKFQLTTVISFLIVGILSMVEISGTSMGLYSVVGKEMDDKNLAKVLRTNGLSTGVSGIVGGVGIVPFVQNFGILDITKVFSRYTTAFAGIILIVLSFFPKTAALINAIPKPVLGGISFSIFGGIIASGASMLKNVEMEGNHNKLVVGLSLGVAMIPAFFPNFYDGFPQIVVDILGNGIVAGGLTAIVLNIVFNFKTIFAKAEVPNACE